MTPAARVQGAIEVLDRVLAGAPAEQALTGWARASRFAGSGDRAAVRDHVFAALRCLRSFTALAGAAEPSGRALMIGALRDGPVPHDDLFNGAPHAPAGLSDSERTALAAAPPFPDLPAHVQADCPDWLAPELEAGLGADFGAVMAAQRRRAPVFLRANLARASRDRVAALLAGDGIGTRPCDLADTALEVLGNSGRIKQSRAYLDGIVELQDASSQAAVSLLPLRDGMTVLDYCAGGGGKTLAIAARARCRLTAHDADPARLRDLPVRAGRAGVSVELADRRRLRHRTFDLVLVDAPCSGSGTWRRTPDAKWRLTPARLDELVALQDRIMAEAAAHVRPGGILAYMTCSLLARENEERAGRFASGGGFALALARRFAPTSGGDGFFAALLTRR